VDVVDHRLVDNAHGGGVGIRNRHLYDPGEYWNHDAVGDDQRRGSLDHHDSEPVDHSDDYRSAVERADREVSEGMLEVAK
jgi:hypothetical protein